MTPQLRVMQVNLGRGERAQDIALQTAQEKRVDVLLLLELYRPPANNGRWAFDCSKKVAIVATGSLPLQRIWCSNTPGLVAAEIGGTTFLSCYAPPRQPTDEFERFIEAVQLETLTHSQVVIAGDFNAWHVEWGSERNSEKGEELLSAIQQLDLVVLNQGTTSTFDGNGAATASIVDVAFATPTIAQPGTWNVCGDYSYSDHRYITYTVGTIVPVVNEPSSPRMRHQGRIRHADRRYKATQFSQRAFRARFSERAVSHERMVEIMLATCDKTMQRVTTSHSDPHRDLFWWTPLLRLLRENCDRARDRMRQTSDLQERSIAAAEHRTARAELGKAIKASKRNSFQELIDIAEENVFGAGYLVVLSHLRGGRTPPETERDRLEHIVSDLFPQHPPLVWPEAADIEGEEQPGAVADVSDDELKLIARRMANKKAPGLDGIPNAAVKAAILEHTGVFTALYQDCLVNGTFPAAWKRQRLVLIPKPGKPSGVSCSYRPLCMLDALGKVLERLILNRLHEFLEDPESPRLSDRQYGFRRGCSTIGLIQRVVEAGQRAMSFGRANRRDKRFLLVAALDVRNAFNTASWQAIATALRTKRVPAGLQRIIHSYFQDRELVYETSEGPVVRSVTAGVPQGSILGPTLWNTMYDGVLDIALPPDAEILGYADDLVLLVPGTTPDNVKAAAEEAIISVMEWMARHHLELAPAKTEMVVISSTKAPTRITVRVGDVDVTSSRSIRYLGVTLQDKLSWLPHVKEVTERAGKIADATSRLLRNHSEPRASKAKLLASVSESVMRYAAPVWSKELQKREPGRLLERVQRKMALRVARAFRTVRYETATLLAGLTPICLLLDEDARVYQRLSAVNRTDTRANIRKQERQATIEQWQQQWDAEADTSRHTRWAHRVLPNIGSWQSRKHGDVSFHLCQVLSGHGFFRDYLCRNGFTSSPDCQRCSGVPETAEHAMFECPRFAEVRQQLLGEGITDPVRPENLQQHLLRDAESWSRICEAAKRITASLQQAWDDERAALAAHGNEQHFEEVADLEARRAEIRRARNDRRNASRRAARARQRELQRAGRPPSPPPSPRTAARRADLRLRQARFRARRRQAI
uniref:Reverse transcriptase n=2 Tax=Anopheles gambiae TaxID=7165 RepID=Q868S8_ANOGA|nr:reverse transcriptase [Anopheles gambiae]